MTALRRERRAPKRKLVGSMGGDGRVTSRYVDAGVVTTAVQASNYCYVDPPKHSISNDPGSVIIRNYSNYIVTSSKFMYVPAVGTTTTGTIWIAYIDNPEMIHKIVTGVYSLADRTNIVQNMSTARAGPIWEPLEVSMSRPPRLKMFNVDSTFPTFIEDCNRSSQGLWLWVTTSAPISTTLGTTLQEYTCRGENLQPLVFTGV